jgi:hypothetical protein
VKQNDRKKQIKNINAYLNIAFEKDFRVEESDYDKNKRFKKEAVVCKEQEKKEKEKEDRSKKIALENYKKEQIHEWLR